MTKQNDKSLMDLFEEMNAKKQELEDYLKSIAPRIADSTLPEFGVIATSKLAEIEIADKDYTEGDKKYFTFAEALEVEKKMEGTGWRLPTRHEWALICEEFANGEDDKLKPELLKKKLGLGKHGYYNPDIKKVYNPGYNANYWSRSSLDSNYAFYLYFIDTDVYPSSYWTRYNGFSLRLVRDLNWEE